MVPSLKHLVIIGPSGVGKGTLINRLMSSFSHVFELSVSSTTRKPRCEERDGIDKHFISKEEYDECLAKGKYLSYGSYCGNYYATKQSVVDSIAMKSKICILENAIEGVEMISEKGVQANYVFIMPPSLEELRTRLQRRGSETNLQINKRIEIAEKEVQKTETVDFITLKLVNDDFEQFYATLKSYLAKMYPHFDFSEKKVNCA